MKVLFNKNFSVTAAKIQALAGTRYQAWASHSDPRQAMMAAAPNQLTEPKGLLGAAYCEWLLGACQERGIDYLIAGKERELLATFAPAFAQKGTHVITPASEATQRHLERKDEFLRDWDTTILPIPDWATFDSLSGFEAATARLKREGTRLCMKPARGIYASGFRVLLEKPDPKSFFKGELYQMSMQAARELLEQSEATGELPTMLLMHTLEGPERSIDCVAWQGRLIRAVVRRKGGMGQQIEDRPDLLRAAQQIAQKYDLSGIFNFQTKDDTLPVNGEYGVAHMLEINARASGGLRYSMAANVNFPLLLLDAATGVLDWDNLPTVQTDILVAENKGVRVCA